MNFEELEGDIKSLEQSAKDLIVTDADTYERAKHFSQSCSNLNIWLNKLLTTIGDCNKTVAAKLSAYEKSVKQSPSPNACVACSGTGKASTGAPCKPCNGTGKKVMPEKAVPATAPVSSPPSTIQAEAKASTPAPAPSLSLDDFDDAPASEEDELAIELQKSLF